MRTTQHERLAAYIERLERENAAMRETLARHGIAVDQAEREAECCAAPARREGVQSACCDLFVRYNALDAFVRYNLDPILVIGRDRKIINANDAYERSFGWSAEEVVGLDVLDAPLVPEADRESLVRRIRALFADSKPVIGVEATGVTRGGSLRSLVITLLPLLVFDRDDRCWVVVIRDVTDRNREEELTRKADRLSVMGQLAAGVAHELRNPLTTVKGFVQLIRSKPASLKSYYLDLIMEEMERIEYFIKELLVLAKPQALKMDNRSPAVMIGDAVASLAPMAEESGVAIECRLPQGLPTVRCEEAQLKQVFLNVIQNAIEAMPDGGTVRIEGHATDRGEVVVTVADEGAGMPPERLSRLGEPFYTTKEKGTGLGLMLSLKIMAEHDGTLAFESGTGGTTVTVTLPAG